MKSLRLILLLLLGLLPLGVLAAPEFTALRVSPPSEDGSQTYSVTLQVLGFMTAMTFLPLALMMMTSFARIIIVLAILRQALGTMSTPSNQILLGLSLFLTVFIMMPVFDRAYEQGLKPYMDEQVSLQQALETGSQPFREFMMAQTRDTDIGLFAEISGAGELDTPDKVPFSLLMPAFLTSELKTAFQIGFLIMIPFLVIDLVVASLLMSMGMMMLSPMIISLPFKIMLFVLIDGWSLVMGTLATSFYV